MKHRLMLGGFAASLLAGVAGAALAEGAIDAPLMLADRTLVRLERLDVTVDPASGEPSEASRRRLARLLADEARRGCVVAAQVLGRIDARELDGDDLLGAHRRARARAEHAAALLGDAGIERDRIVAGWDPSRAGDPGRLTIWLMTDWSESACGILPAEPLGVALAPPPVGPGIAPAPAPTGIGEVASTGSGVAAAGPSAAEPRAVASVEPTGPDRAPAVPVAGADAIGAPDAAGATGTEVTSTQPERPDALVTLRRLVARIGELFERPEPDRAAGSSTGPSGSIAIAGTPPMPEPPTVTADRRMAPPDAADHAAVAAPRRDLVALVPPRLEPPAPPQPAEPKHRVAPSGSSAAAETAPWPPVRDAAAWPAPAAGSSSASSAAASAAPSIDLPDAEGQLRGLPEAGRVPVLTAAISAPAGPPSSLPEPAAGGPSPELAFRFPENSSILDAAQKRELQKLAESLPGDRELRLRLTVAVGAGDVTGADEQGARRYNRWLAERRAARVERWLRHFAGDRPLVIETELHEGDPSRTARLSLSGPG